MNVRGRISGGEEDDISMREKLSGIYMSASGGGGETHHMYAITSATTKVDRDDAPRPFFFLLVGGETVYTDDVARVLRTLRPSKQSKSKCG